MIFLVCECCSNEVNSRKCKKRKCEGGFKYVCECGENLSTEEIRNHKCKIENQRSQKLFQYSSGDGNISNGGVGNLYIGNDEFGLIKVNSRKRTSNFQNSNSKSRDDFVHRCLDILSKILSNETSCKKVFVDSIMRYDDIKQKIDIANNEAFSMGVEEGIEKFVDHFANVAPIFVAGTKVTADTYDKLVNLLFFKQLGLNGGTVLQEIECVNEAFKNKHKVGIDSTYELKVSKVPKYLLNNNSLKIIVTNIVTEMGGFDKCKIEKKFSLIARETCKQIESVNYPNIEQIQATLQGTDGGKYVKLLFCDHNKVAYEPAKKFKSSPLQIIDSRGGKHQINTYGSKLSSRNIMSELRSKCIGMVDHENVNRVRISLKSNDIQIECGSDTIMVSDLSKGVGKTFIGEVISRTLDSLDVVYRYFDIRVVILHHFWQLILKGLINPSNLTKDIYTIEYIKWNGSAPIEKASYYAHAIQLLQHEIFSNLNESEINFLRKVLLICYSWQGDNATSSEILNQQMTESAIDLENFEFKYPHPTKSPSTNTIFKFKRRLFCADNKSKQLSLGNSVGGHKRCNQCDENFDSNELTCYDPSRNEEITMEKVLERAKLGRKEINHKLGLKRVSGFVSAYFSERQKVNLENFHKFFNRYTKSYCIEVSSANNYDLAWKTYENTIKVDTRLVDNILHVCSPTIESWFKIEQNQLVTYRKCSCTGMKKVLCSNICEHVCLHFIYLHYNRNNISLEDLALNDLEICSDASHVIPGLFDRLKQKLTDEKGFKIDIFNHNAKKILGHSVSLGMISHSDKKFLILRGTDLFGEELPVEYTVLHPNNFLTFDINVSPLDMDLKTSFELLTTETLPSSSIPKPNDNDVGTNKHVVKQSLNNLKWILTMLEIVTSISVMSEETFKKHETKYHCAFHVCSFLFGMLCVERFGKEMHTLYMHELMMHLTKQLKKFRLTTSGTDMFEGFFAPLKKQYQKGCHRKNEADIQVAIKQSQKSQLGLLLPQFEKNNNNSKISKLLETFELKNLFVPKEFILSSNNCKNSFGAKMKELCEIFPTISNMVVIRADGILFKFNDKPEIYLNLTSTILVFLVFSLIETYYNI